MCSAKSRWRCGWPIAGRWSRRRRRRGDSSCIAHVLPFFPEYQWARKVIASGKYGGLKGGAFRRVIAEPTWLEKFWSPDHIGGPMLDLHVHDAHFIRLLFGMPQEVTATGRMRDGLAEFWHAQFRFANPNHVVEATSGTIDQQGRAFDHGFEIHLERCDARFRVRRDRRTRPLFVRAGSVGQPRQSAAAEIARRRPGGRLCR